MTEKSLLPRFLGNPSQNLEMIPSLDVRAAARTICGFLNGEGGTLLIGVSDDEVVGIGEGVEAEAQKLGSDLKRLVSPAPFLGVDLVEWNDKNVIVVEVPKGIDGPYVVEGGIWMRSATNTRLATIPELRKLLDIEVEQVRWERRSSPQANEQDLDIDEIRSVVRDAQQNNRFPFTDPSDDKLVLNDLSLYGDGVLTNAGDALFSRSPVSRHPQCRVQLLVVQGSKLDSAYTDNRSLDGPLVRTCSELLMAIQSTVATRASFAADAPHRSDRPDYDLFAIREGVVNAFVHRDYSMYSGGLKVIVYDDRIEIWNSGSLPKGLKPSDLKRGHPSIPVNPDIAQAFYLRGYMERIGRGTELIANSSKRLGAPPPKWNLTDAGVTLTIFSARNSEGGVDLNERQAALVMYLRNGDPISARDYALRFANGITARQARRDLDELVKLRLVTVIGGGRSTLYRKW